MNEILKRINMYYVQFTMIMTDGKVRVVNVEPQEESDQRAYCNEGVRGGWMKSWTSEDIAEEY